ncbi:FxsA family protein [Phytoactinopolyspora endophytica]|uniref:FxsA family protein n=1 Tax=Phytoactinopolyspora endophytica TaxID=1642495 RepID=UPI00101CB929|nr:FxsA family protein [Phytoactinopolyspora endophytica]
MSHEQLNPHRRRTLSAFGPFLAAVAEIVAFVAVGNWIGFGYAILLALATSVFGLWIMRRAGFRAWRSLREAAVRAAQTTDESQVQDQTGIHVQRSPEEEIAGAGVTLLAGTMLLLPGFVTDATALLLLLPPIRKSVGRRLAAAALRTFPYRGTPGQPGVRHRGDVVEGEVLGDSTGQPPRSDAQQQDEG